MSTSWTSLWTPCTAVSPRLASCAGYDTSLVHGWVAAEDHEGFAGELELALAAGIARPGMGWDRVLPLLRGAGSEVATSLSAGNWFPDRQIALDAGTWRPDLGDADDKADQMDAWWDELGDANCWQVCAQALHSLPCPQWKPGRADYRFGQFTIKS